MESFDWEVTDGFDNRRAVSLRRSDLFRHGRREPENMPAKRNG